MTRRWHCVVHMLVGITALLGLFGAVGAAYAIAYYSLTYQDADANQTPGLNESVVIQGGTFTIPSGTFIVGAGLLQSFVRVQPATNVNCGGSRPCADAGYTARGGATGNVNKARFETKENEGQNWNHAQAVKIYDSVQGFTTPQAAINNPLDSTVGLDYLLNSSSGQRVVLVVRVPDALFDPNELVYLYSSFGELGINADGGGNKPNKPAANLPTGDFGQTSGF